MRVDKILRYIHLYTGLFLVPWMLVYGTSALFLNHRRFLTETLGVKRPTWEVHREVEFVPDQRFPEGPKDQARELLRHLGLDGPHHVAGKPTPERLVVFRQSGGGHFRITWQRDKDLVLVERRSFSLIFLTNYLHMRSGYGQPYFATIFWAVIVDMVAISIWLWVITGIYIWWRRRRKYWYDWASIGAGVFLFAALAIILCN